MTNLVTKKPSLPQRNGKALIALFAASAALAGGAQAFAPTPAAAFISNCWDEGGQCDAGTSTGSGPEGDPAGPGPGYGSAPGYSAPDFGNDTADPTPDRSPGAPADQDSGANGPGADDRGADDASEGSTWDEWTNEDDHQPSNDGQTGHRGHGEKNDEPESPDTKTEPVPGDISDAGPSSAFDNLFASPRNWLKNLLHVLDDSTSSSGEGVIERLVHSAKRALFGEHDCTTNQSELKAHEDMLRIWEKMGRDAIANDPETRRLKDQIRVCEP